MPELTRRFFLLGSAAAVAAATIPAAIIIEEIVRLPSAHAFLDRRIMDFTMWFDQPAGSPDQMVHVRLFIAGREGPFYNLSLNTRGYFRWFSHDPLEHPLLLPGDTFRVECKYSREDIPAIMQCICADKVDEGPPIHLVENHTFRGGVIESSGPMFLEMDNSLEARLERKRKSEEASAEYERKVAAGEITEDDYDDEFEDEDEA